MTVGMSPFAPRKNAAFVERKATIIALLALSAVVGWIMSTTTAARADESPDPIFEKPAPITMAELAKRGTEGVSVLEVSDYAPGHYTGKLSPSPPHADLNPKKAVIVFWKEHTGAVRLQPRSELLPLSGIAQRCRHVQSVLRGQHGQRRTVE